MKVALLADPIFSPIKGGIPRYTLELAAQLMTMPAVSLQLFSLYTPTQLEQAIKEITSANAYSIKQDKFKQEALMRIAGVQSPIRRPMQYLLWHLAGWTGSAAHVIKEADIVHSPTLIVPPRRLCPLVVTVHDLSCSLFPKHHTWKNRLVTVSGMRRAAHEADALITDAECTADDLVRLTGISRSKIYPVPLAADPRFTPTADDTVLKRYGIDRPYILYVGTLEPRKNVLLLLKAFAALNHARLKAHTGSEIKLVIAGKKGWLYQDILDQAQQSGLSNRIVFTDFVQDADLPALYSGAEIFVYPSLFEGFGLPVLEAMSCGAPVITTNVSSLPEVAGNAALMVAPEDVNGLTRLLEQTLLESDLREELRGKSLERAKLFSWEKTAQMTVDVYRAVLAKS